MKNKLASWRKRASSLVTTLLVVTILTVIVIAFLQSMTIEKRTAISYSNLAKARLSAEAGTEEAMAVVRKLFLDYPDSATAWVTNMAPSNQTPGTAFYYYDAVSVTNTAPTGPQLYFRPLISGATNVLFANRATAFSGVTNSNWINLNSSNLTGDHAWIGKAPGTATDPKIEIPWVNVLDGTKVVGRYAYWIEDESFRVNLNVATNVPRGSSSLGTNASEIPLQGALRGATNLPDDNVRGTVATNIVQIRQKLPFDGELRSLPNINYANTTYPDLSEDLKFITTLSSGGLNVSRTGARRVNINKLVGTNTAATSTNDIRKELDRIIMAITNQAPQFGQRFYRTTADLNAPSVPAANATIYLNKIAANIRDYLDSDSIPTVVSNNGSISLTPSPVRPFGRWNQPNPAWAIGKENVPRLQEASIHVWQQPMSSPGNNSSYDIRIAYYLEFWNMGTRDIVVGSDGNDDTDDLPADTYLGISNQMEWVQQDGTLKVSTPADFTIPLADFEGANGGRLIFPAGGVTVLATTRTFPPSGILPNSATVYRPKITYAGTLELPPFRFQGSVNWSPATGGYQSAATLVSRGREGTAPSSPSNTGTQDANWDASTEVFLGTATGWIESRLGSIIVAPGVFVDSFSGGDNRKANNPQTIHWRGGALTGNMNGSGSQAFFASGGNYQIGDPRAGNEQLVYTDSRTSTAYKTAFTRSRGNSSFQSASSYADTASTLGSPNSYYTRPETGRMWDEGNNARTTTPLASGGSPAFYRNGLLQSTAELGNIYDPARGLITTSVEYASGGGRTFNVGRSETTPSQGSAFAFWDGNPDSPSRRWVAWRLLDFFTTTDEVQVKGLVNPNGALRDGGRAVQAMLEGFAFSSSNQLTDSTVRNQTLTTNAIAAFGASLKSYLTNATNLPFFERGQLSELDYFNTNTVPNFKSMNDRGAEELYRRMADMITTKGNTYTVYAIGQAVETLPNGKLKPLATATRKVSFRLTPQYSGTNTDTNYAFDPSNSLSISNQFSSPTNYAVDVLSQQE